MLLITFLELLFLENYEMSKDLWQSLSLLPSCFMVLIIIFIISMGNIRRGSPLLNHLQAWGRVTPLKGSLFALARYRTFLKTISRAPNCVFPSVVNDAHIMGPMRETVYTFDHLLTLVGLRVKVWKCKLWNPSKISSNINIPQGCTLVTDGSRILGV
jgi:hypothetical protein